MYFFSVIGHCFQTKIFFLFDALFTRPEFNRKSLQGLTGLLHRKFIIVSIIGINKAEREAGRKPFPSCKYCF